MVKGGDIGGFGGGGWAPSGSASSWKCRAAQGRLARPEEATEPSCGTANGGTLILLPRRWRVAGRPSWACRAATRR
eukprot:scaffold68605_cov57-Phaeocystis_antarctica.AAC.3